MKRAVYFLVIGLAFIAIGIFMWAKTATFMNVISILFSIYLIFDGGKSLVTLPKLNGVNNKGLKISLVVKAIVEILVGIIAIIVVASHWQADWRNNIALKAMAYLIGVNFLVTAIVDFADWIVLAKNKFKAGGLLVEAGLDCVFGILFCIFPQNLSHAIIVIIAVLIIIAGVLTGSYAIHSMVMVHTLKKYGIDVRLDKQQAVADFEEVKEEDKKDK